MDLVDEAFRVRGVNYLATSKLTAEAYWTMCSKDNKSIDKKGLIGMLEYLIDNIYVSVGNRTYRQCIGIPMGTDCAPLLANLFFNYEYQRVGRLSMYRDGADMPRPPYVGKACTRPNLEDLSLFRYLTIVYIRVTMYPITLTNCLKYIARVICGKRKNRDFLHLLLPFLLLLLQTT